MRLKLGEQYEGWTLRSVQKREAMLVKDQQIAVFEMPPPGKGGEAGNELLPSGPDETSPGIQIIRSDGRAENRSFETVGSLDDVPNPTRTFGEGVDRRRSDLPAGTG